MSYRYMAVLAVFFAPFPARVRGRAGRGQKRNRPERFRNPSARRGRSGSGCRRHPGRVPL